MDRVAAEARAEEVERVRVAEKALAQEERKRVQEETKRQEAEKAKGKAERRRRWMALALGVILVLLVYVFVVREFILEPMKTLFPSEPPPQKQTPSTTFNVPVDWQEFKSAAGFSVRMPGKPEILPVEGWTFHKLVWKEKRMIFLVGSSRTLTREEMLEPRLWNDIREGISVLLPGGTVKQETPITFGSNKGREYVVDSFYANANARLHLRGVFRYFLVGKNMIVINVGYPANSDPTEARLFLDSFKIELSK
jgi:hypothetical protein